MRRINWGQAAGEALLILIGILLALGADAWWAEQSERKRERSYLEALAGEFAQIESHTRGVMRTAQEIEDAGRAILQISENWQAGPAQADSLSVLLVTLSQEVEWSPPLTVYQDLVNTGAVGVIRSEAVRHGLNELLGVMEWIESREIRHNEFFWTQMEPYLRLQFPILAMFEYSGLPTPSEPWVPGDFVGAVEFQNLVAAKSLTAVDVREGGEELLAMLGGLRETVLQEAGAP